jgi:hypothetical protein
VREEIKKFTLYIGICKSFSREVEKKEETLRDVIPLQNHCQ